eukprot:54675_1
MPVQNRFKHIPNTYVDYASDGTAAIRYQGKGKKGGGTFKDPLKLANRLWKDYQGSFVNKLLSPSELLFEDHKFDKNNRIDKILRKKHREIYKTIYDRLQFKIKKKKK